MDLVKLFSSVPTHEVVSFLFFSPANTRKLLAAIM